MAHLMSLLSGMTPARLHGLARNWQIEATVEPRTLVSQLYNEMSDEQAVKFRYESLSPRERFVLDRVCGEQKGWVSVKDLERELPFAGANLKTVLAELEDVGFVVVAPTLVSGNSIVENPWFVDRSHPSAQITVVRLPSEISSILRRMKIQADVGDQSDKTLHKLLGGLTLPQLQQLSSRWRIPHSEQCFKRELMLLLEDTISRRKCVEETLSRLGEDATTVFRTVCDAGGRISVDSLKEGSRLLEKALRLGVGNLVYHLLLTETYVDGQRYLFVPAGVSRDDDPGDSREVHLCSEMEREQEIVEPKKVYQANYAFFFDLLVITTFLEANDVELAGRDLRLPRWAVNHIKEELAVVAGSGFGSIRLDCLMRVASKLGLVGTRDERIVSTDKVDEWVALGVRGQARALFDLWLEDDCWCNEHRAYPIVLDANKYRSIRRSLLSSLRKCRPGLWYKVDDIAEAVIGKRADGAEVARLHPASAECADAAYRETVRRVVALSLGTLLYWTSGLSLGYDEGMEPSVVSISKVGEWLFNGHGNSRKLLPSQRGLVVLPNFEVMLHQADPEAWRWLLKFAVTVSVGRVSLHQITKRKVQQAVSRGCCAADFVRFLVGRSQDRGKVPREVIISILDWADGAKSPPLAKQVVLEVENAATMDHLMATTKYGKWISQRLSSTRALIREMADVERLIRDMRSEGFSSRVSH